ncbi:hypothetical protein NB311A_19175 [Nitrobacter sp. Nb-311A]|nr:hypothetical protein NB311A_19175 [Nitrobacter sp. Nb-311A]
MQEFETLYMAVRRLPSFAGPHPHKAEKTEILHDCK